MKYIIFQLVTITKSKLSDIFEKNRCKQKAPILSEIFCGESQCLLCIFSANLRERLSKCAFFGPGKVNLCMYQLQRAMGGRTCKGNM